MQRNYEPILVVCTYKQVTFNSSKINFVYYIHSNFIAVSDIDVMTNLSPVEKCIRNIDTYRNRIIEITV